VANVAVARDFPGAAKVLQGFELAGERALRHGDRVLYGVEVARGDVVTRNLLQIEVVAETVTPVGTLRFDGGAARTVGCTARMVCRRAAVSRARGAANTNCSPWKG
jgi:hypothetical protein